jgi:hypothetical protein
MAENSMSNPDVTSVKSLKAVQGDESAEGGLETKLPAAPFSLQAGKSPNADVESESGKVSPMSLQANSPTGGATGLPSTDDLVKQAQQISSKIQEAHQTLQTAQQQLKTPDIPFKPSTSELLTQHLNHVNDNLSVISSRLNLPAQTPPKKEDGHPITEYFLNYLIGSDKQLQEVTQQLTVPPKGGAFNPADMLAIQVKMNGVQQQMQFFTTLLGKAIDNIKTIMNIQN